MTHIFVSKLTLIVSDNGLSPGWHQAIFRTIAGILLIEPLGTRFSEIIHFQPRKCIWKSLLRNGDHFVSMSCVMVDLANGSAASHYLNKCCLACACIFTQVYFMCISICTIYLKKMTNERGQWVH